MNCFVITASIVSSVTIVITVSIVGWVWIASILVTLKGPDRDFLRVAKEVKYYFRWLTSSYRELTRKPTHRPEKFDRAVFNWVSKVISELLWFMITSLSDWFKVLAPVFQPIRSETKTNRGSRAHIFPRFVSATCNYFEFWLFYWILSVLFDWTK